MLYCYHLYCNSQNRLQPNLHFSNTVPDSTLPHLKIFYAQCLALLLYKIRTEGLYAFFRKNFQKKHSKLRLKLGKKLKKRCLIMRAVRPFYTKLKEVEEIPVGVRTKFKPSHP